MRLTNYPYDDPIVGRPPENFVHDAMFDFRVEEYDSRAFIVKVAAGHVGPVHTREKAAALIESMQAVLNEPGEVQLRAEEAVEKAVKDRQSEREESARRHVSIQRTAADFMDREGVEPTEGDVLLLPQYVGYGRYPVCVLTVREGSEWVERTWGTTTEMVECARQEFEGRVMLVHGQNHDKFRFERKGKKANRQYKTVFRIKVKQEAAYYGARSSVYSLTDADYDTREEAEKAIAKRVKSMRKEIRKQYKERHGKYPGDFELRQLVTTRYGRMFVDTVKVAVKKGEKA